MPCRGFFYLNSENTSLRRIKCTEVIFTFTMSFSLQGTRNKMECLNDLPFIDIFCSKVNQNLSFHSFQSLVRISC